LSAKADVQVASIHAQDDSAFAREKRDLTKRLQTLKNNVDAQLTQLRAESGNAQKEAQKDYKASIDNLQKMSKQLQSEIEQTQNSTSVKWKDFMNNMNKNADEAEKELTQLQKKIKKLFRTDKNKKQV
jgi:archaellum component FlaC